MESLIIVVLLLALVFVVWKYIQLRRRLRAEQTRLLVEEQHIREDAIKKSEAVIRGMVTQHLRPFFPDFAYSPKDARFLGTPIDLIVFDGLSEGAVRNVVFIEVKKGEE